MTKSQNHCVLFLIGFLLLKLVACSENVHPVVDTNPVDHHSYTQTRKELGGLAVYNCPTVTGYIKKFTRELDYTAYFGQTDGDYSKAQHVVFKAMNKTLSSSLDEDEISTAVEAFDDRFVRMKYVKVTPKKVAVSMAATSPETNNVWLEYQGVRVEIKFLYESCTDASKLTSTVYKETIASLTKKKTQLATRFEQNLYVPEGFEFGYLTWTDN
jgi:hypothetical protein